MKRVDYPQHYNILCADDQLSYQELSEKLKKDTHSQFRRKTESFQTIFDRLQGFINKSENDVWKRSLVSGLCIISPDKIAINSRQLMKLTELSKTTINSYFSAIGYKSSTKPEDIKEVYKIIPYLKTNQGLIRQWTIRYKEEKETVPSSPVVPTENE